MQQKVSDLCKIRHLPSMNPQSQGTTSSSPVDPPLKRKRGRPRKDENVPQGENMPATPAADSMKKDKQSPQSTKNVRDKNIPPENQHSPNGIKLNLNKLKR